VCKRQSHGTSNIAVTAFAAGQRIGNRLQKLAAAIGTNMLSRGPDDLKLMIS
jgi:hypothetical protein